MLPNEEFINSSITEILKETTTVVDLSCTGIESFPLQDYLLQSTFLKMTGYLEQKIKCICWDIGTIDYEFRYQILHDWRDFGTFSEYEKIKKVLDRIVKVIIKYDDLYVLDTHISGIVFQEVHDLLADSNIAAYSGGAFFKFKTNKKFFQNKKFEDFAQIYKDQIYTRRNSIAHNTKSYQQNLPRLIKICDSNTERFNHYFFYFAILAIYDRYFVEAYKKCVKELQQNKW